MTAEGAWIRALRHPVTFNPSGNPSPCDYNATIMCQWLKGVL